MPKITKKYLQRIIKEEITGLRLQDEFLKWAMKIGMDPVDIARNQKFITGPKHARNLQAFQTMKLDMRDGSLRHRLISKPLKPGRSYRRPLAGERIRRAGPKHAGGPNVRQRISGKDVAKLRNIEKEIAKLGKAPRSASRALRGTARSVARMLGPALIGLELGITASDIEQAYKRGGLSAVGDYVGERAKEDAKHAMYGPGYTGANMIMGVIDLLKKHRAPPMKAGENTGAGGTRGSIRW